MLPRAVASAIAQTIGGDKTALDGWDAGLLAKSAEHALSRED